MDRPVGQHRLDPRDQRAHRPEAQHLRAAGIGRDQPADGAASARAQGQRESACRPRPRGRGGWRGSCPLRPPPARLPALIDRSRSIRRSDRISADPSAGGVAPPTIDVLPPCGTSGTRCSAASGDHRRDLLGRIRARASPATRHESARASRSATARSRRRRSPPTSARNARRGSSAFWLGLGSCLLVARRSGARQTLFGSWLSRRIAAKACAKRFTGWL